MPTNSLLTLTVWEIRDSFVIWAWLEMTLNRCYGSMPDPKGCPISCQ